jgi:hypothetical protein
MKLVKNFVLTVLLASTLAVTAFAGDIETPGFIPPPPPRVMASNETSTPVSNAETSQSYVAPETSDYLLLKALVALLSVY